MKKILSYTFAFFVISIFTVFSTVCAEGLTVSKDGTSVIEAENVSFQYASLKNSDEASGTQYVVFDCGIGAANQTFILTVDAAGYYTLDMIAGVFGANDAYSSVSIQINEDTVKTLTGSDIDGSKGSFNGYAGLPQKYFKVYEKVYLSEGENPVKITLGARPGFPTNILAQFDAFIINPYVESSPDPTPTPTPGPEVPVINGDNYLIEAEAQISGYSVKDNECASGGKVVVFNGASSNDASVELVFDVEEDGDYIFSFLAANTLTNKWISTMSFGIGGDMIEMSAANFIISSPEESYIDNDYPIKILRYNKTVALKAGRNSIIIKVKLRSYGDLAAALDCIHIRKQKDITSGISVEDMVVREGETAEVILKNAAGERLHEYDVDSISSALSEYGIAGAEGLKVKAYNRGKTEFTVTVNKNDEIKTAKGNIIVVGDAGIYINDIKKNSSTIAAKISAVTDYSGGDYLLIAVYDVNGKVKSSLKGALAVRQIPEITEGGAAELTVPIDSVGDGDCFVAYIIDTTYKKALYGKTMID